MTDTPSWPRPVRLSDLGPDERRRLLSRASPDDGDIESTVRAILDDVRLRRDEAVMEYTKRFDGVTPPSMLLGPSDFKAALETTDPALRVAMERAVDNLERVAEATYPVEATHVEVEPGLTVTEMHVPLSRVGAYVPGGKAAYPSSVLMTVVPAKVAGVPEVIVASPPGPDGRPPAAVLAACALAEADACLVAGGAQAIAALAYGTDIVAPVDKIVGPGNRYVTAAKRIVFGTVDIDAPAGPTEVLILADGTADPEWIALDLVAQAEHSDDARCLLVTTEPALATAVADRLPRITADSDRRDTITAALTRHGAVLVADSPEMALAFATAYAPEHLQVMTEDPDAWADEVPTAATTFLGAYAPVPAGDYLTGANHVLPTAGAARWAAPLSVHDFLVRRTLQRISPAAAASLADDLAVFARSEGLHGHARAMLARKRPEERP